MPTIHLVIPFLDEPTTLKAIVDRVFAVHWPAGWDASVILVNDGSDERTRSEAGSIEGSHPSIHLIHHDRNRGKGAAVRTGFAVAVERADPEDLIGIQDADLEYSPEDLGRFVDVFEVQGEDVDVVFGNRWSQAATTPVSWLHRLGNRALTELSNAATGLRLNDMECCFKMFRPAMLRRMLPELDEPRFAIEPQLAAVAARHGANVAEVDVNYQPRSFAEGKKIGLRDLVSALAAIGREWFRTRRVRSGVRR